MRARKPVSPRMVALRAVGSPCSTRCMTSTAMARTVLSLLIAYTARARAAQKDVSGSARSAGQAQHVWGPNSPATQCVSIRSSLSRAAHGRLSAILAPAQGSGRTQGRQRSAAICKHELHGGACGACCKAWLRARISAARTWQIVGHLGARPVVRAHVGHAAQRRRKHDQPSGALLGRALRRWPARMLCWSEGSTAQSQTWPALRSTARPPACAHAAGHRHVGTVSKHPACSVWLAGRV